MIRERQVNSVSFSDGGLSVVDLPRDAVYHMIQLSVFGGTWVSVQGSMGTGPALESNFPFSLIRSVRLIRNGSDVVFQGSGAQLAKEHYYLNKAAPFARLYTTSSNVETLRTATVRGITVPANPDGICANGGGFSIPDAAGSSVTLQFDMEVELWLQMGPSDAWYGTLLDARSLASFQLEIQWATVASLNIPGTANTSNTVTANFAISSIDQDNLKVDEPLGTFKRSTISQSQIPYSTSNFQVLLPRGNFFQGIIFQTRAQKAASTTVLFPENNVLGQIQNRINSNYYLRSTTFQLLQAKNMSDAGGRPQPYSTAQGMPQGWAYLYYPSASDQASELVPSYVMDQFDLQLTTQALSASQNGVTTSSTNPAIDLFMQEIIPGADIGKNAPQGAVNGSIARTTVKPYSK